MYLCTRTQGSYLCRDHMSKGLSKWGHLPSQLLQVFLSTGLLWGRLLKKVLWRVRKSKGAKANRLQANCISGWTQWKSTSLQGVLPNSLPDGDSVQGGLDLTLNPPSHPFPILPCKSLWYLGLVPDACTSESSDGPSPGC